MGQPLVLFILGFLFLIAGGDFFVRGASGLALSFRIPPFIIGLTVVALGTSAPEFMIAVQSALSDHMDLSIGNVIGSNIYNIFVILGVSALIRPIELPQKEIRVPLIWVTAVSFVFLLVSLDLKIHPFEGALLAGIGLFYLAFSLYKSRVLKKSSAARAVPHITHPVLSRFKPVFVSMFFLAMGGWLLSLGSNWLVTAAVDVARGMGVSEFFIGVAVVAVGTTLPELAASLAALLKNDEDIALGNILGSCIYNLSLIIGGVSGLFSRTIEIHARVVRLDMVFMVAAFSLCFLALNRFKRMGRLAGILFLAIYAGYLILQLR